MGAPAATWTAPPSFAVRCAHPGGASSAAKLDGVRRQRLCASAAACERAVREHACEPHRDVASPSIRAALRSLRWPHGARAAAPLQGRPGADGGGCPRHARSARRSERTTPRRVQRVSAAIGRLPRTPPGVGYAAGSAPRPASRASDARARQRQLLLMCRQPRAPLARKRRRLRRRLASRVCFASVRLAVTHRAALRARAACVEFGAVRRLSRAARPTRRALRRSVAPAPGPARTSSRSRICLPSGRVSESTTSRACCAGPPSLFLLQVPLAVPLNLH